MIRDLQKLPLSFLSVAPMQALSTSGMNRFPLPILSLTILVTQLIIQMTHLSLLLNLISQHGYRTITCAATWPM